MVFIVLGSSLDFQ